MKKMFFVIAFGAMISLTACGQSNKNVPANVKSAFSQKFPQATKAKWDKENATEWEVEFKMNGKNYSANYSTTGIWKETEYAIKKSEIPSNVKNTLNNEFAGFKIKESEISETVTGVIYEFELKKGKTILEVGINKSGKVVKKAKENEDNEDND